MKKKVLGLLLVCTLVITNFGNLFYFQTTEAAQVSEIKENYDITCMSIDDVSEKTKLEDLSGEYKDTINYAVSIAEESGEEAAKALNLLDEDNEIMELGVKEVLDTYYSAENIDEKAVCEFSDNLETDIEENIENYEKARKERENEENLDYIADEGIVVFDKETTKEDIDAVVDYVSDSYEILIDNDFEVDVSLNERKQKRLKALENYKGNIVVKVNLDLDQTAAEAVKEYEIFDCVIEAQENIKCESNALSTKLNDVKAKELWYLDRCKFQAAWDTVSTAGCDDIWIGLVDSGCRITHKDLSGGIVRKYAVDITKKDSNGKYKRLEDVKKPYDSEHGTFTAGVIAAKANNSMGIAGAARGWNNNSCRIIPIKVSGGLNADGEDIIKLSDMCKGINHAIKSGAEIINVSLSYSSLKSCEVEAIERAEAAGVVVVASAGNYETSTKRYPAAMDYVIAVGGTNKSTANNKAYFSSYGNWVNIVAPATNYVCTSSESDSSYSEEEGTSLATPLVSSAIGLMLSVNPDLSVSQIKKILYSSSIDLKSSYFSCGLLNAGLSVQKAKYEIFKNSVVNLKGIEQLSGNRVKLKWNNLNVYGPEKVLIYRSASKNGKYENIKYISGDDSCTYIDTNLTSGKTYYYKIRAAMKYGGGYKYTPYSEIKSIKLK